MPKKPVKKQIKKYNYRKKDGKTVKVPTHKRTYHTGKTKKTITPVHKWNIRNKYRDISLDLGSTANGNQSKVYILRQDFGQGESEKYEYHITYSVRSEDNSRWLGYSEHTIKTKIPEDANIIRKAIDYNPMN